jgi:hypothetical protein
MNGTSNTAYSLLGRIDAVRVVACARVEENRWDQAASRSCCPPPPPPIWHKARRRSTAFHPAASCHAALGVRAPGRRVRSVSARPPRRETKRGNPPPSSGSRPRRARAARISAPTDRPRAIQAPTISLVPVERPSLHAVFRRTRFRFTHHPRRGSRHCFHPGFRCTCHSGGSTHRLFSFF